MESLGNTKTNNRRILYISTQRDTDWHKKLPESNWIGFIICDFDNTEYMTDIASKCIDKNIGYVCIAGDFCEKLHDIFDEEITSRGIEIKNHSRKKYDFENTPLTTWHNNFEEGLWFAMVSTYDGQKEFDKLVCIDCTVKGVKKHIQKLISRINGSWLPSNEKIKEPEYDN